MMMRLNTLSSPHRRKKARRVGRGMGSGLGKTCGRGHKGQRARAGARRDGAFEGGQMPLHRRVPKRGFISRLKRQTAKVRIRDIARLAAKDESLSQITLEELKQRGVVNKSVKRARLFCDGAVGGEGGNLPRAVSVSSEILLSASARKAIFASGGIAAEKGKVKSLKKTKAGGAGKKAADSESGQEGK